MFDNILYLYKKYRNNVSVIKKNKIMYARKSG